MADPRVDEYDKAVGDRITPDIRARRQAILKAVGWDSTCGDVPGHFRDYPRGSQLLWSCNWASSHGMLTPPGMGWNTDVMTLEELALEAQDILNRPRMIQPELSRHMALFGRWDICDPRYWADRAQAVLGPPRGAYQDFVAHWDLPLIDSPGGNLMQLIVRRGWVDEQALRERVRGG